VTTTAPTPITPRQSVTGPVRHRQGRSAAIIAVVAAVIAAGGYGAVALVGSDAQPPQSVPAQRSPPATVPTDQALRELDQSIAGQYGHQSAANATVTPSAQALRELDKSIAGQYGHQSAANATVTPSAQALGELNQSIAGQYRPTR
jgi:hypothetical protein